MTTHIHYPHFHLPAVVRRHIGLFATLAAVVIVAALAGLWLAQRSSPPSESATADWTQEYNADTPLVTYANPGPALFVGAEANLDPDIARWGQSEYNADTPLVTYTNQGATYWIGTEANLDPDE